MKKKTTKSIKNNKLKTLNIYNPWVNRGFFLFLMGWMFSSCFLMGFDGVVRGASE
jgi:hypothetical protein